jgi:hypothetical protein
MDTKILLDTIETQHSSSTFEPLSELADLELALVGGGSGDVIVC